MGGDVLDVGLLEEADAGGDVEGDVAAGELHLELEGVEVGAVEDGDALEGLALVAELEDALGDEDGLLGPGDGWDEGGGGSIGTAGVEGLLELALVGGNGGVGDVEDLGGAAVVGLDSEHAGAGVALGEVEDVGEVGPAPRVDALGVVADDGEVAMEAGHEVHEGCLEVVGILVFVHEHGLEPLLVERADVGVLGHEAAPQDEEVIKVHEAGAALALGEALLDGGELGRQGNEGRMILGDDVGKGPSRVHGGGEEVAQGVGLGEARGLHVHAGLADAGAEEVLDVLAVGHGEVGAIADAVGMETQDAKADGVEGAAPELGEVAAEEVPDAAHHLLGGLVGEGEKEDAMGWEAVFDEPRDAVGEGAGLAGAGACEDEGGAGRGGDGLVLLGV